MPRINLDNAGNEGGDSKLVDAPGSYLVKVGHVSVKTGEKGEYWNLLLEVLDGPKKGYITFANLSWSGNAVYYFKLAHDAMGALQQGEADYNPENILGSVVRVKIEASGNEKYPFQIAKNGGWSAATEEERLAHFKL